MNELPLGFTITVRRTTLGMSRKDLAEAAHISYNFLCNVEKDEKKPGWETLVSICKALKFGSVRDMVLWASKLDQLMKEDV